MRRTTDPKKAFKEKTSPNLSMSQSRKIKEEKVARRKGEEKVDYKRTLKHVKFFMDPVKSQGKRSQNG